jgi:hypothetical protein
MLLDAAARGELPDVVAFVDVGDPEDLGSPRCRHSYHSPRLISRMKKPKH